MDVLEVKNEEHSYGETKFLHFLLNFLLVCASRFQLKIKK